MIQNLSLRRQSFPVGYATQWSKAITKTQRLLPYGNAKGEHSASLRDATAKAPAMTIGHFYYLDYYNANASRYNGEPPSARWLINSHQPLTLVLLKFGIALHQSKQHGIHRGLAGELLPAL